MVQKIRLKTIAALVILLCSCSARNEQQEIPPALNSKGEVKSEPAIAELARLAQAAQTEQERRGVCLRAIDEGRVYAGGPVSTLDQIFGTQFASQLPTEETVAKRLILFAKQPEPPAQPERTEAIGYVGSYLDVDYDHEGKLRYYSISNLHKGMSSRVFAGESAPPIAELKRLYELADSESQRREIALRAIDEGVIQTFPPVNVSIVDTVFGSHLASTIATGKQRTQTGIINFGSGSGWFMAVDYDRNGTITNYYLTNIRK
jgi:hypothetical protein